MLTFLVLLYAVAVAKGYPLLRKYDFESFSVDHIDNPFSTDYSQDPPVRNENMGVYFSLKESRKMNWIIPGLYDHEQYGSPYSLDLHINSKTINELSNFKFELNADDGQQVVYVPENGELTLETAAHLTVYSRHIYPLEYSAPLDWQKINRLRLHLQFSAFNEGVESAIEVTQTYTKKNSPTYRGNPLYVDLFMRR